MTQPSSLSPPPLVETAGGEGATRGDRRRGAPGRGRKYLELALFLGPPLLIFFTFVLLPVILAATYSLYRWNGIGPLENFVGLENYRTALTDQVFRRAVGNTFFFVVASIAVQLPIALGAAILLNRKMKGRSIFRAVIFVPYVLSEVITGVAWTLILQPGTLVDTVLRGLGAGEAVQLWLADPDVVLWTLLIIISWKYIGFAIILFLAGLQSVPDELMEAAAIDGASWWQTQWHITLPLLGPTIRVWVFLSMIGSLQLFDLVWIMTGGGPAGSSNTMATYLMERGFRRSQFGYGSAVAVILFSISFVLALVYQRFVLSRDNEAASSRRVT